MSACHSYFPGAGMRDRFCRKYIYHTFWFCCLWGILAALAVIALIRRQLWKHLPTLLLHGSFLVILAGAMLTFVGSRKGYVHLTVGNKVGSFVEQESGRRMDLPLHYSWTAFGWNTIPVRKLLRIMSAIFVSCGRGRIRTVPLAAAPFP